MKKTTSSQKRRDSPRRVLARVLADKLDGVYGSTIVTVLSPAPSSPLSEAATSESIPDS